MDSALKVLDMAPPLTYENDTERMMSGFVIRCADLGQQCPFIRTGFTIANAYATTRGSRRSGPKKALDPVYMHLFVYIRIWLWHIDLPSQIL
jgi:hypothetical protein